MKQHKQLPITDSQGLAHSRKIKTTFAQRHPFLSSLTKPKILLLEGLLLVGIVLAANKAFAQQPITPVKDKTEETGNGQEKTLSPRDKLMFLTELMIAGIQRFGEAQTLESLKIEYKELGIPEEVTQAIFDIVSQNLKRGITDPVKITDQVEKKVEVKVKRVPVNPNETTLGKNPPPSFVVARSN